MAVTRLDAEPFARVGAMLGEGPVWVERDRSLWFVDIKAPCVHRIHPATGRLKTWTSPSAIGWVLPARDGAFLAGLTDGLYRFTPKDGDFVLVVPVERDVPGNRLNDAAIDSAGGVWFGSMDDGEAAATGRVYRYADGGVSDSGVAPVVITNGPAISPDGRTLYAVDTLGRTVDVWTIGDDATLGDGRRFLTLETTTGYPDGATCDAAGGVWIAFFGGWAARRYAPDGALTHEVRFPTANVTKIAIGGGDGCTGYATTARKELDEAALAAQPLAGDVFTFAAPFPGVPVRPVAA